MVKKLISSTITIQQPGNTVLMQDMQSYYKRGVFWLLSKHEQAEGISQLVQLWHAHPAAVLGDAVIKWSKTHPNAPDLPELLYKVNRLPKWSFLDSTGSKYSHAAYNILHKNYPNSVWAKKAVCWY
jgi:hypothetical protein